MLSKLLKRAFNLSRPEVAIEEGHDDPGFPRSHAHMLAFVACFLSIELRNPESEKHIFRVVNSSKLFPSYLSMYESNTAAALSIALWMCTILGGYWRIRMQRHTYAQVIAGFVSGTGGLCDRTFDNVSTNYIFIL